MNKQSMNYFIKTSFLIILGIIVGTTQTCAQQEFKRNIEMRTFIPKGQWIVGSSVSYSQYSNDNYQFLVIENLSGEGYAFKVSPVLCYAFKDNVAAGGRFMYSRTYTKLNNISVNIDEDTNFDISNLYELKNSYSGIAVLRNYINLQMTFPKNLLCRYVACCIVMKFNILMRRIIFILVIF